MDRLDFSALLDRAVQPPAAQEEGSGEDVATLEQWIERMPDHVTGHVALAYACERCDRRRAARRHWESARLLLPHSPAVRAGLERTAPVGPEPEEDADVVLFETSPLEAPSPKTSAPAAGTSHAPEGADDLDGLIEELQGARIEPTRDLDDVPAPDLAAGENPGDDMVSPTLARIYEAQGQHAEAARIYRRLAEVQPEQASAHRQKAEAMEARAEEQRTTEADDEPAPPGEKEGTPAAERG